MKDVKGGCFVGRLLLWIVLFSWAEALGPLAGIRMVARWWVCRCTGGAKALVELGEHDG